MIKIFIDSGEINIPESIHELTIENVFDFFIEDEKLLDDQRTESLFNAIAVLYGETIFSLPVGNDYDKFTLATDVTALGLYNYTIGLINGYKPKLKETFAVEHHGETYEINNKDHAGLFFSVGLTVGEVITVNTFVQNASKRKSKGLENVDFNLTLEQIATILRKPNEKLPIQTAERIKFIDSRKHIFKDLPYSTALDIVFFLTSLPRPFLPT